jgi:hypothetical protein
MPPVGFEPTTFGLKVRRTQVLSAVQTVLRRAGFVRHALISAQFATNFATKMVDGLRYLRDADPIIRGPRDDSGKGPTGSSRRHTTWPSCHGGIPAASDYRIAPKAAHRTRVPGWRVRREVARSE